MKYNEPIRPKGIGRKQLAFPVISTFSELANAESEFERNASGNSVIYQAEDTSISMDGFAEVSSYSAATATQNDVQNFCIEMDQISNFSFYSDAPIQFGRMCVKSPFIDYDSRSQQFYCKKPGWYLINCFIHHTGTQGNYDWYMYLNTNINVGTNLYEQYPQYMVYSNVYQHCSLRGTALYNVPVQSDSEYNNNVRPFQIYLGTSFGGTNTLTNANTKLNLQIIYLGELPQSTRTTYSI